jgi:UDP-N-acetylmuramoylalanine--D-glutamate ligase
MSPNEGPLVTASALPEGRLALLGLGVENRALAAWLAAHDRTFTICDANPACSAAGQEWAPAVDTWHLGEDYLRDLHQFDVAFRSPGIHALHPLLVDARESSTIVTSQTQLFLERCPAFVVGVTGTKGKGTTAAMLASILRAAGRACRLAGNIGIPPVRFLDELNSADLVILELSSFQLQDLTRSPDAAIILAIDVDHLDVHADRGEYVEAKTSVCRFHTPDAWVVCAGDDDTARSVARLGPSRPVTATASSSVPTTGTWIEDDMIRWCTDQEDRSLASVEAIGVRGLHNVANACVASAAAVLLGVEAYQIETGLRSFTPLPHRLEEVGTIDGVLFVNDSLATTPVAAAAAIEAYDDRPLVVISGGASKNAEYEALGRALAQHATAIVLLGEEGQRIADAAALAGYQGPVATAAGMEIAVGVARRLVPAGGVVLLAPGCASFGMFRDYAERGEIFRQVVAGLLP